VTTEAPPPSPRVVAARRRGPVFRAILSLGVTAVDVLLLAIALGGFRAVFSHPRAPALVGVWAVAGMTLALLRPVRSQEVVRATAESRLALVGLGLIPLVIPPLAAWGERLSLWTLPGGSALGWTGVGLAAIGLGTRIAAMTRLGPRFSPLVAVQRVHELETRGLYGIIRHPGYAGSWLAALGAVLAFRSGLGLVPLALFSALLAQRVAREEALMEAQFGEAWRAYRSRTWAFVPTMRPGP
jgi:protein-S-isoprenylcysteine O-methyltransferase Ste14